MAKNSINHKTRINEISVHIAKDLDHQFLSTQVSIKKIHGITFLTGNIKNYINAWDESGAPLKFVLKKKEAFANSEQDTSQQFLNYFSRNISTTFRNEIRSTYNILQKFE
jgi:hypothetical protein